MSGQPPTPPSGILIIDKPSGISSMRAVEMVRRGMGGLRTGHAGTLDPLATGVLIVAVGAATRSISKFMNLEKQYETTIDLSATTATLDGESERVETVRSAPEPDAETVQRALQKFTGTHQQVPPDFSAKSIKGRRAYDIARSGEKVVLAPRTVTVRSISMLSFAWPLVRLAICCDKGFYVRSLAGDLGAALGGGGYCTAIRRTAIGPYTLEQAIELKQEALPNPSQLLPLPPDAGH